MEDKPLLCIRRWSCLYAWHLAMRSSIQQADARNAWSALVDYENTRDVAFHLAQPTPPGIALVSKRPSAVACQLFEGMPGPKVNALEGLARGDKLGLQR